MICPKCQCEITKVYDSRLTQSDKAVRRRRECARCGYRFTTLEEVKVLALNVEKRNKQVVAFSEEKLRKGVRKAFNKRTIDNNKIDKLVQSVIEDVLAANRNPIKSRRIGKILLKNLKKVDEAAYICYWAMYGNFDTAEDFNRLLEEFRS